MPRPDAIAVAHASRRAASTLVSTSGLTTLSNHQCLAVIIEVIRGARIAITIQSLLRQERHPTRQTPTLPNPARSPG